MVEEEAAVVTTAVNPKMVLIVLADVMNADLPIKEEEEDVDMVEEAEVEDRRPKSILGGPMSIWVPAVAMIGNNVIPTAAAEAVVGAEDAVMPVRMNVAFMVT